MRVRHSFRADEFAGALDQHNQSEEKRRGIQIPIGALSTRQRMNKRGIDERPTVNAIHHALSDPRSSLGVSLLPLLKEVLARNAARPVSRQRKRYRSGWLPTHVQLQRDFAPPKGR